MVSTQVFRENIFHDVAKIFGIIDSIECQQYISFQYQLQWK